METNVILLNEMADGEKAILQAGEIIKRGSLVAFPTETVYGLGGDALNTESSKKIYEAKGRPSDNPLIVHIAGMEDLLKIVNEIPEQAKALAEKFWPGPLTMVLHKSETVPEETTGGLKTVAVRMPNHKTALELIRAAGGYIAAPSANTSGRPSPTKGKYVVEDMMGKIDMILVDDEIEIGLESTIIDLTEEIPMILRPGFITKKMLEEVIGCVMTDPGILTHDSNRAPKAPGMKYRHYAPRAGLILVKGQETAVVDKINSLVSEAKKRGKRSGIIGTDETCQKYREGIVKSIGTRKNEDTIAQHLYGILREFDELNVDIIYSESFSTAGIGQAIMNRMLKAAGYRVLEV